MGWKEGKHPSSKIHVSTHDSILDTVHRVGILSFIQGSFIQGSFIQGKQIEHTPVSFIQTGGGSLHENINKTDTNRIFFKTLL